MRISADPLTPPPAASLLSLPPELLFKISAHLSVIDICRLAQVNRHLRTIADSADIWKPLYRSVFEYDEPLFHVPPSFYVFRSSATSQLVNPWKVSYSHLHQAVHVRPFFDQRLCRAGNTHYFNSVKAAIEYAKHRQMIGQEANTTRTSDVPTEQYDLFFPTRGLNKRGSKVTKTRKYQANNKLNALVIVHSGYYYEAPITIDWNVAVVGAASGNEIYRKVKIFSKVRWVLSFQSGAHNAYVGHMTLVMEARGLDVRLYGTNCVNVNDNSTPTIEHCTIDTDSLVQSLVQVSGRGANPRIQYCDLNARNGINGLSVTRHASGVYENNLMSVIRVRNAKPMLRELDLNQLGLIVNMAKSIVMVTRNGVCTKLYSSIENKVGPPGVSI